MTVKWPGVDPTASLSQSNKKVKGAMPHPEHRRVLISLSVTTESVGERPLSL